MKSTIDDDFSDDEIFVVLNKEATLSFKEYTSDDFIELGDVLVEEITKGTSKIVKSKYLYNVDTENHAVKISDDYRRIYKITLEDKGKNKVLEAIKKLESRSDIKSAEPNYIIDVTVDSAPQDYINYGNDCCPQDNDSKKWWINRIGLDKVWDLNLNLKSIDVAVFDTGVDFTHPDLVGKKSIIPGQAYSDEYPEDEDMSGHGTNVASIICGTQNNGGMLGVFDKVKIVSYRLSLSGDYPDILNTLIYAVEDVSEKGIRIINFSAGGYDGTCSSNETFKQILLNYDGLFICAAGNDGYDNNDDDYFVERFPSNVDASNLIAVGASTPEDSIWGYSNVGETTVDLFAPGYCIYSAVPITNCGSNNSICEDAMKHCFHDVNGYHYVTGTSQATPVVSGSVAILYSLLDELPNISFDNRSDFEIIKNIMLDTVDITNV